MSIKILQPGVLSTIQDAGRHGFRALGIGPGGAMDFLAAALANRLVGNQPNEAVLEMHFPAATMLFEKSAVIAIAGADFAPTINQTPIANNQPIAVAAGSELRFAKWQKGARVYLALAGGFAIAPWLNSRSTNLVAQAGGWQGRALQKNDCLPFATRTIAKAEPLDATILKAALESYDKPAPIRCVVGPEWDRLSPNAQKQWKENKYTIQSTANRMGYRLQSEVLAQSQQQEMVSSPVGMGTVQCLPNGQLVILMADHQTSGGYPRLATVIRADWPRLAQMKANDTLQLEMVSMELAMKEWMRWSLWMK
jgi:antagonist of KipI